MQRLAIANLLGGASPAGSKFQMPDLGKGFMSMGAGGPQAPVQREIQPMPVIGPELLPLAAGDATGAGQQQMAQTQPLPDPQPMQANTGTTSSGTAAVSQADPMPFVGGPQPPITPWVDPRSQPFVGGTQEPVTPWVDPREQSKFFG